MVRTNLSLIVSLQHAGCERRLLQWMELKKCSANLYDKKWIQFKQFCVDINLQEGNGILDPEGEGDPFVKIVSKILAFFIYKVIERTVILGR